MGNIVVWADIPVTDMDRASKFYAHVTGREVASMPGGAEVSLIMGDREEGNIVSADLYMGKPSQEGSTVYLGSNGDIQAMVARVREAGGTVLQEPQNMGDMVGWIAFFVDSEGNRVGIQQAADTK